MPLMSSLPILEHVQASNLYASVAGVGAGVATGFEAHCWCLWRAVSSPFANVTDGGLLANGDGTDGWGISFDYAVATGLTTFSATFGDTGGAAVAVTSAARSGVFGRFMLLSAFAAADGAVALALNGDVIASGTLVGAFSPAAADRFVVGGSNFGFTPVADMSFAGVAYEESAIASLASIRQKAPQRFQAVVQTLRMWKVLGHQNSAASPTDPVEFTNAWDGLSLSQSGPTTGTTVDRNLAPDTWLPRSGTDNLVREGEGSVLNNLFGWDLTTTPWVAT